MDPMVALAITPAPGFYACTSHCGVLACFADCASLISARGQPAVSDTRPTHIEDGYPSLVAPALDRGPWPAPAAGRSRRHVRDDLGGAGDAGGALVADERVAASRHCRGDETGTAISGRARSRACRAVAIVPLRSAASTMTVPRASAAMMRLRARSIDRLGEFQGLQVSLDAARAKLAKAEQAHSGQADLGIPTIRGTR